MVKTKFVFWMAMLVFCISLFGCGQKETATLVTQEKESPPQELLMWLVGSESQAKIIQQLGNEFFQGKRVNFRCEAISPELA